MLCPRTSPRTLAHRRERRASGCLCGGQLRVAYAYETRARTSRCDDRRRRRCVLPDHVHGLREVGSHCPERCQPFDLNRRAIPAEGGAALILERVEDARARGARVYALVSGYGLSCDAYHPTSMLPDAAGAARAMREALKESQIEPHEVSYISAHGTGTPTNDKLETLAIKHVFGKAAYRVPVSSVKSMIGHAMGAASAIEAAVCALAVYTDHVPPTTNLETPDPECDLDYVTSGLRIHRVDVALNNAYGFGGCNSSVVFRK